MQIKKSTVAKLVEAGSAIDKASRRKSLTPKDVAALSSSAVRFVRSVLTTLRKLK